MHRLRQTAHQLPSIFGLHRHQLILPAAIAPTLGNLIADHQILPVGREAHAAHTTPVGEVVEHVGMGLREGIVNSAVGLYRDLHRVGVTGLRQVLDGHCMVLGRELQVRGLLLVDKDLEVLQSLDLQRGLEVVAVVDVEGQHTHRLPVAERGHHTSFIHSRGRRRETDGLQQRLLVERLALHVDSVNGDGRHHRKGTSMIELGNLGLHLSRGRQRHHCQSQQMDFLHLKLAKVELFSIRRQR